MGVTAKESVFLKPSWTEIHQTAGKKSDVIRAPELVLISKNPLDCGAVKGGDLSLCAMPTDNIVDEDESAPTRNARLQILNTCRQF
ncbi:MAG: hypothetical protein C5B49_08730 [Bdellovibrio sp.]|nr:MAG: hypothetical protein C5B49_08730 [Bdellovibrio sp.]